MFGQVASSRFDELPRTASSPCLLKCLLTALHRCVALHITCKAVAPLLPCSAIASEWRLLPVLVLLLSPAGRCQSASPCLTCVSDMCVCTCLWVRVCQAACVCVSTTLSFLVCAVLLDSTAQQISLYNWCVLLLCVGAAKGCCVCGVLMLVCSQSATQHGMAL